MSVLSKGRLRSRRYVKVVLKKSLMGWDFEKGMYKRASGCFHRKVEFYKQPYKSQAICGMWAIININCVQKKDRGEGKTFNGD